MKALIMRNTGFLVGIVSVLVIAACGGRIDDATDKQETSYHAASTLVRTARGVWVACNGIISRHGDGTLWICTLASNIDLATGRGDLISCKAGASIQIDINGNLATCALLTDTNVKISRGRSINCKAGNSIQVDQSGTLGLCTLSANTNMLTGAGSWINCLSSNSVTLYWGDTLQACTLVDNQRLDWRNCLGGGLITFDRWGGVSYCTEM